MKILQVISSFPPAFSYGGALKVAYDLSKELVNNGHDVTVFTTDVLDNDNRYNSKINPEYVEGMRIYRFKNISNRLARKNYPFAPFMFFLTGKIVKEVDIIHLHEYRSFQAIFIYHWAKKFHIPYVIQAHGSVLPQFEKVKLKKIFDLFWGIRILRDASKLIAVSKIEKEQYLKMGIFEEKISIIPNGIDIKDFKNLPVKGKFREKYGILPNEKIILYLGRIHKIKGIDFLVNSFSILLKNGENLKLVIIGPDDGYLASITNLVKNLKIENEVIICGPLYKEEKMEAYIDADLLIYPSTLEIFGLVPFEAILCGTPVIVADNCGCGEIIKSANCGSVIKFGDTKELINTIIKHLNNKNWCDSLIIKGNYFIRNKICWPIIIIQIENIYKDVIKNFLM